MFVKQTVGGKYKSTLCVHMMCTFFMFANNFLSYLLLVQAAMTVIAQVPMVKRTVLIVGASCIQRNENNSIILFDG